MVVLNSTLMFGVPLNNVQSTAVLSHVSDLFLVLLAFLFVWFLLTLIIALVFINKGKKKGQVLRVFIISLILLLVVLFFASMSMGRLLMMIGGV
jgi:hypothetical protein